MDNDQADNTSKAPIQPNMEYCYGIIPGQGFATISIVKIFTKFDSF